MHGAVTVCDVQLQRVSLYEANPICFLYTPQHQRSLTPSLTTRVDPRTTRAFIPSLTVGRDLPYTTAVEAPPRRTRDTRRELLGVRHPHPPRATDSDLARMRISAQTNSVAILRRRFDNFDVTMAAW